SFTAVAEQSVPARQDAWRPSELTQAAHGHGVAYILAPARGAEPAAEDAAGRRAASLHGRGQLAGGLDRVGGNPEPLGDHVAGTKPQSAQAQPRGARQRSRRGITDALH